MLTARIDRHSVAPKTNSSQRRRHSGFFPRSSYQCRAIPIIDNENVRNTLIEYITPSAETSPPVAHKAAKAETPINKIPLCVANRSERLPNQWGTNES